MAQEQMLRARELIKTKQYAEARQILKAVDHPKAREWLVKLDELELGDPFASALAPATGPSRLLQEAAAIMVQHDWEPKLQMQDMAQFEKRKSVSSLLAVLLIVLFSLLGSLIVCLAIATAKVEKVTLQADGPGRLKVTSRKGTFGITDLAQVTSLAQSVRGKGATYASAILLGVVTFIIVYVFFMPRYY